ncbi:duf218 domain protein [Colletotrichum scovillei]|uniref:DUF218 domain-containing protein n=1 Tax=Colletotrichum scovillei TaxID=1209932 RepID=A0A9P7QRE3_9PEZI|nr:duf218 domain protein [Colletotrichum scovillei]KAF4775114.1 duf218 domain protein [Colletotrichum scovillei]KAG7039025.1 duf218 domain protein [Colletotrichum scovillei]KAG7041207.1 duf218 domain protein [Colletotrichum scovillei]KAG7061239.1 DUF218 domain protein [Colletotrichum scovillei]
MANAACAINTLSSFLSHEEIEDVDGLNQFFRSLPNPAALSSLEQHQATDVIVFCASSVLSLADVVFSAVATNGLESKEQIYTEGRNTVLVLCGGIGHSTPFLYEAIENHPVYNVLADEVQGKAESRVLQLIAERWYGVQIHDVGSVEATIQPDDTNKFLVVVEDRSTNCGGNAAESKRVLEACGVYSPRSIVIVQDPTMSRRTVATFQRAYQQQSNVLPQIKSWPTFTPQVRFIDTTMDNVDKDVMAQLVFDGEECTHKTRGGMWSIGRFVDLLMGEIPRLRDDEAGYGPRGKDFIVHVTIPESVDVAWATLYNLLGKQRRS